jgi:hypothetical protein
MLLSSTNTAPEHLLRLTRLPWAKSTAWQVAAVAPGALQGTSGMWLRVSMERCICCKVPYGADGGDLGRRRETDQTRSGGAMPAHPGARTSPLRFALALPGRASRGLPDPPRPFSACSAHSSLQLPHRWAPAQSLAPPGDPRFIRPSRPGF